MTSRTPLTRCLRQDLASGLGLLTRIPTYWLFTARQETHAAPWPLARSMWCWPYLGAAIGLLVGALGWALEAYFSLAPLPTAALMLAAQAALTGCFHEDGLADMADSYGAHTRARKLEIMRDSHVGSYGVAALCLSFLVRGGSLAALPPAALPAACALAGLLARAALLLVPASLAPARADGLARSLNPLPWGAFLVAQGSTLAGYVAWCVWWHAAFHPGPMPLVLPLAGSLLAVLCLCRAASKQLGGYTGDVLGATAIVAECLALAALSASFRP